MYSIRDFEKLMMSSEEVSDLLFRLSYADKETVMNLLSSVKDVTEKDRVSLLLSTYKNGLLPETPTAHVDAAMKYYFRAGIFDSVPHTKIAVDPNFKLEIMKSSYANNTCYAMYQISTQVCLTVHGFTTTKQVSCGGKLDWLMFHTKEQMMDWVKTVWKHAFNELLSMSITHMGTLPLEQLEPYLTAVVGLIKEHAENPLWLSGRLDVNTAAVIKKAIGIGETKAIELSPIFSLLNEVDDRAFYEDSEGICVQCGGSAPLILVKNEDGSYTRKNKTDQVYKRLELAAKMKH